MLPIADLSPVRASPLSNAAAKENISSFNRLASVVNKKKNAANHEIREQIKVNLKASPNNDTIASARRPLGTLSTRNNIPRHVSLVKKPSGNSNGGKALKVLGELQNVDKERKGKESTNVKDRVKEWERERERLREMARLEEMQRESDDIYEKKKKKERVKGKAKKVRIVNSEEKPSEKEGKGEETNAETELEIETDKEGLSAKKDVSPPAALQIVHSASDLKWDKDFSATSPVSPMFRSNPPLIQGLCTLFYGVIIMILASNIIPQQ